MIRWIKKVIRRERTVRSITHTIEILDRRLDLLELALRRGADRAQLSKQYREGSKDLIDGIMAVTLTEGMKIPKRVFGPYQRLRAREDRLLTPLL